MFRFQVKQGEEMLSYEDCVAMCGLRPEEVAAIAQHEHVPEMIAMELGACLCQTPEGRQLIRRMTVACATTTSDGRDTARRLLRANRA